MRRAFTMPELVFLGAALCVLALMAMVLMKPRRTGIATQIKDASQVRLTHQGMLVWAGDNRGEFPLPSRIDLDNATIDPGEQSVESKDTTANIMSALVFSGYIQAWTLRSPAELNPNIVAKEDFAMSNPAGAAVPAGARWDPTFRANLGAASTSHVSYAHIPPSGARRSLWKDAADSIDPRTPILGNRGPEVASVTRRASVASGATGEVEWRLRSARSVTLAMHGGKRTWEGHVAYADNAVIFEASAAPPTGTTIDALGRRWRDVLFFDEADDPSGLNAFMSIFARAGARPEEFVATWD